MKLFGKIGSLLLWPGNALCDALGVHGEDHRLILRAFTNLLVYGIAGMIVMLLLLQQAGPA